MQIFTAAFYTFLRICPARAADRGGIFSAGSYFAELHVLIPASFFGAWAVDSRTMRLA